MRGGVGKGKGRGGEGRGKDVIEGRRLRWGGGRTYVAAGIVVEET